MWLVFFYYYFCIERGQVIYIQVTSLIYENIKVNFKIDRKFKNYLVNSRFSSTLVM
jgi:hypothetical protein